MYVLLDRDGNRHEFETVRGFAREHNLDPGNLQRVVDGLRNHCGGYHLPEIHFTRGRKPWNLDLPAI